jgi:hypothetical protein
MPLRIHVETLHDQTRYTDAQVQLATRIAHALRRGRLVLCEPPRR